MKFPLRALIASALAASSASYAQQPAEAPEAAQDPDILVEGARERRELIRDFIRTAVAEEPAGQYAKFEAPICPSVFGFSDAVARFMEGRMRDVAEAAEVAIAQEGCKANIHLVAVADGPEAIRELREKRRGAFGQMPLYERRKLEALPGPVYDWHIVAPIGMDGNSDRSQPGAGLSNDQSLSSGGVYGMLSDDRWKTGKSNTKSRVLQPVRQTMTHAVVMIEKDALLGLSPVQIADFGILTALARAEDDTAESPQVTSIRTVFSAAQEDAPKTLTDWDLALLKSLYASRGDLRAAAQRSAMVRVFEKTLEEQQP